MYTALIKIVLDAIAAALAEKLLALIVDMVSGYVDILLDILGHTIAISHF
jgi:hypothetical protein